MHVQVIHVSIIIHVITLETHIIVFVEQIIKVPIVKFSMDNSLLNKNDKTKISFNKIWIFCHFLQNKKNKKFYLRRYSFRSKFFSDDYERTDISD